MDRDIPMFQMKDFSGIKGICLLVGNQCNMKCRHCYEVNDVNFCLSSNKISPKVWVFITHFIDYYRKNFSGTNEEKHYISFWGGEPLLHWHFIKSFVVKIFKEYPDFLDAGFCFSFTSNGSLLTKDIVDFINQYKIRFEFSYDAPYPWAVRDYVSDKICELVNKIDNFVIHSSCINRYNCDPLLTYECLRQKFFNTNEININPRIWKSFDFSNDIMDFDWDAIASNFKKLRIAMQLGNKFALNQYLRYVKILYADSSERTSYRVLSCAHNLNGINITLDGKCCFCSSLYKFFNTIEDTFDDYCKKTIEFSKTIESSECNECRHADICRKHCLLDGKHSDGSFVTCKVFWQPFYDVIKKELQESCLPLSEEDKNWFLQQKEIMKKQVEEFLREGKRYEIERTRLPKDMMGDNII